MLSAEGLAVHIGARTLFENVSFFVRPHDRIGLVGPNGSGKTTLLKVIAGAQEQDAGSINAASYVSVGYLPQDGMTVQGRTLYAEAETAFEDITRIQKGHDDAIAALALHEPGSDEHNELIEIAGELHHRLEELDAYSVKARVEKVLLGLGFSMEDMERLTDEFSGGWQMRIALAKLLLKTPSVLLLDEPTNHLDIESQAWLEDYLAQYDGAIMIVSHDTVFLDRITNRTLAFDRQMLFDFPGPFSAYVDRLMMQKEQLEREFANQQKQIARTQKFIDRFRYKATKARQVQSRIKQLDKIERIDLPDAQEEIEFSFPPPPSSGKVLLTLTNIVKAYGPKTVFDGLSFTIDRGDRVAVVGVNGAGKSTMARIIAGVEPFQSGERKTGHNLVASYYAQHQADELDLSLEALEVLDRVATGEIRKRLRSILGSFLFHGDDVFKKVSVLSGGEKSRLALARMLLQPANLLILDEPTNHLDVRSKSVLQDALEAYDGSFVIVSHDRGFLDPIVNKVVEVSKTGIRTFLMTVTEYVEKRQEELKGRSVSGEKGKGKGEKGEGGRGGGEEGREMRDEAPGSPRTSSKERRRQEAALRQEKAELLRPFKKRLEKAEKEIARLEGEIRAKEVAMADPSFYEQGADVHKTTKELKDLRKQLEMVMIEWESVGVQMEEAEAKARLT